MKSGQIIINNHVCDDNYEKTVKRVYDWDGKLVSFSLCETHSSNPIFDGFVSETKINVDPKN